MSIRCSVLTISDRSARGERPDSSGPLLISRCLELGWQISGSAIVPDEPSRIQEVLIDWANEDKTDLVLTTGGTGFAPRDITPEATQTVIHRFAPGIAEAMRQESLRKTPHAMLSRGIAGIRNQTLIINLPGSPKAALENLEVILPVLQHAIDLLHDSPNSEAKHTYTNR